MPKQFLFFAWLFLAAQLATHALWAQNQADTWSFGDSVLLNVGTSPMTNTLFPSRKAGEGTSVCDAAGNLAVTHQHMPPVWTIPNNCTVNPGECNLMQNATGATIPTQWGNDTIPFWTELGYLSILLPQKNNTFYLFFNRSLSALYGAYDFCYVKIDMNANGGAGLVTDSMKIIQSANFQGGAGFIGFTKFCAVPTADGKGWWMYAHGSATDTFNNPVSTAFYRVRLDSSGVSPVQIQHIGTPHDALWSGNSENEAGQMTFNNAGTLLAVTYPRIVELFDVDRCTGLLSNARVIARDSTPFVSYFSGVFSPDDTKLYVSTMNQFYYNSPTEPVSHVFQFDLTAPNIGASRTDIAPLLSLSSNAVGAYTGGYSRMYLANDGRIYVSHFLWNFTPNSLRPWQEKTLSYIEFPNNKSTACGFKQFGLPIANYTISLPNMPNYRTKPILPTATVAGDSAGKVYLTCAGDSVRLGGAARSGVSYQWHIHNQPAHGSLQGATTANPLYRWQDSLAAIGTTDTIVLAATEQLCYGSATLRDTVYVVYTPPAAPAFSLGNDTTVIGCAGDSLKVGIAAVNGWKYRWQANHGAFSDSVAANTFYIWKNNVSDTLTLWVRNTAQPCSGIGRDTLVVLRQLPPPPLAFAGKDTSLVACPGDSLRIGSPAVAGLRYRWQSQGGTFSDSTAAQPYFYVKNGAVMTIHLTVISATQTCNNIASDSLMITQSLPPFPTAFSGNDTTLAACLGDSIRLGEPEKQGYFYYWNVKQGKLSDAVSAQPYYFPPQRAFGEADLRDTITLSVRVPAQRCNNWGEDTTVLTLTSCGKLVIPSAITPNGDIFNEFFEIPALPAGSKLQIFDRYGHMVWEVSNYQNDWNGQHQKGGVVLEGAYVYVLTLPDKTNRTGTVTVLR